MRIIAAPDSFKGSLSASEVAAAMERGVKKVCPQVEVIKIPLSDGGEGLVDSLVGSTGGTIKKLPVTGPLGRVVPSFWGIMGDGRTAVIEMAAASGLPLLTEEEQNPLLTTTYGTGELIRAALDSQCERLILGIGGSATNDGGMGMLQALGASFLDEHGHELPFGGGQLSKLVSIHIENMDPRLQNVEIRVACDVDNPLTGPRGASHIYGPQKGATREMVQVLDRGLAHFARVIQQYLGKEVGHQPGAGAAGGLGAGILAFLNGTLTPGIELVMDAVDFPAYLPGCRLILTGEGKVDAQSAFGKVPVGVARQAKKHQIPVILLAGSVQRGDEIEPLYEEGITALFSIVDGPMPLASAMAKTPALVADTTAELLRIWKVR